MRRRERRGEWWAEGGGGVVVSQRGVSQTAGWQHDTPKEKITAHEAR